MAARTGHGWWPYLVPLFVFLALGELASRLPSAWSPVFLPLRVILPGALFLGFWRRGAYPELRGYPDRPFAPLADAAVGIAGAALWMAPYLWLLRCEPAGWGALPESFRPDPSGAFDPQLLGASLAGLALALRGLGFGVVTPFVEELFVRSWLARYAEVFDQARDFRDVPLARYSLRSLLIVVIFFTVSHMPWEWPVAVLWIIGSQLWFYHRRHLAALVVVHAGSNLGIFAFVLAMSGRLTGADGQLLDLWFFL